MYRFPLSSTAREPMLLSCACTAGIPSAVRPKSRPCPATVVIMPDGSTLRTRPLLLSAMYIFPDASTATQTGLLSCACLAGPPSPPKPAVPFPATVVMFPPGANFLTVLLSGSAIYIYFPLRRTPAHNQMQLRNSHAARGRHPLERQGGMAPATCSESPLGTYLLTIVKMAKY